jgi:hypothetical protein
MRKADRFDLSQHDPATIDLPVSGEHILRDTVAPSLALRLRAGGSRTWVVLTTSNGRTVRRSLGDAVAIPLRAARKLACAGLSHSAQGGATDEGESSQFGPQATVAQVLPRYLTAVRTRRCDRFGLLCGGTPAYRRICGCTISGIASPAIR